MTTITNVIHPYKHTIVPISVIMNAPEIQQRDSSLFVVV